MFLEYNFSLNSATRLIFYLLINLRLLIFNSDSKKFHVFHAISTNLFLILPCFLENKNSHFQYVQFSCPNRRHFYVVLHGKIVLYKMTIFIPFYFSYIMTNLFLTFFIQRKWWLGLEAQKWPIRQKMFVGVFFCCKPKRPLGGCFFQ